MQSNINYTVLRLPEVMKRTGLKRASIYERINEGTFPRNISLGGRSVGWLESEINDWLEKCIAKSRPRL